MPSYDELDNEIWWTREFEPPALAAFNSKLRAHYQLTRSQCGSKGDNRHLRGGHRSRNWCLNSRYCDPSDRDYRNTDPRDKRGSGDALRATDLGISGPRLWDACRRLDAAVRARRLPQVAEWFGTFDGRTVVGWSNGHSSTSDSSHLTHLHLGPWTESTDDPAFFDLLFNVLIGDDMLKDETLPTLPAETLATGDVLPEESRRADIALAYALRNSYAARRAAEAALAKLAQGMPVTLSDAQLDLLADKLAARLPVAPVPPTADAIADAVVAEIAS